MSPIDIHNEINCAMNTLAKLGKANRDDRELMPGRKLLTIDAILNTLPAEFVAETQTMAGQYALGLFSGSIWDGSARTFYTYLSGLERLRQTDPVLDDILNCRKHFNGSFGNATYVCNVQRQSNLMRFFIRYTFPREHLKHLPEITRIFARLLDSPGAHIP
ncbi:hypothetical protein PBRA_001555 [Plasmodiophora brassicae]|nr:hypothetical protein PBRA_001555 [Plasmodiophora brassicae]